MSDAPQKTTAGLAITCRSCGSSIPVQALQPVVLCPFCGKEQIVDQEMLRRLQAYQDRVKSRLDKAQADKKQSEAMDFWYGKMRTGSARYTWIVILLFMAVPIGLSFLSMAVIQAGILPQAAMKLMPALMFGVIILGLVGYYVWFYSGKRKGTQAVSLSETRMACPNCGARNALPPGQVLERCAYCGAMLVPSAQAIQRSLEEVERAARAAEMERFRKEREGLAKVMSYSMGGSVVYFILGPFILMLGVPGAIFTYQMAVGEEPYSPAIFFIWAAFFGVLGALVLIVTMRRSKQRRWSESLGEFARTFGGQVAGGTGGIVGWLNAYWAGPYELINIFAGRYGNGVTFHCQGFPALLFVDPVAASDQHRAKVHLFLAAWIPGVSDASRGEARFDQATTSLIDRLGATGFRVVVQQAGILAEADEHVVKRLRKNPEETAALVPLAGQLVKIASSIQARPVQPIP